MKWEGSTERLRVGSCYYSGGRASLLTDPAHREKKAAPTAPDLGGAEMDLLA